MARPVNKKATLKKQCKEYELSIKESLKLQGINYHAKSLELDVMQTRGHIIHYVYDAITDVRNDAFEFIDYEFCILNGLPIMNWLHSDFSDAQALFISLIVNELYPDIDDLLDKQPNTEALLFPALARYKLNKARAAIEEGSFEKARLLIEEIAIISEMITSDYFSGFLKFGEVLTKIQLEYRLSRIKRKQLTIEHKKLRLAHKKSVSSMRRELVKRTAKYGFSLKLRDLVVEYAENVRLLLEYNNMPNNSIDITFFSVKGLELYNFGGEHKFYDYLSNLAYEFEEEYEELYMQSKMGSDNDPEDIFISLATIRRHLVDIVS